MNTAAMAGRTVVVTGATSGTLSIDGHELTWATNFLGGFLLTRLLLPALPAPSAPARV